MLLDFLLPRMQHDIDIKIRTRTIAGIKLELTHLLLNHPPGGLYTVARPSQLDPGLVSLQPQAFKTCLKILVLSSLNRILLTNWAQKCGGVLCLIVKSEKKQFEGIRF